VRFKNRHDGIVVVHIFVVCFTKLFRQMTF
jgi:hypothetical protein